MNKWEELYAKKKIGTAQAVDMIRPGDQVLSGIGNGQPRALCTALAERIKGGGLEGISYFNTLNINANAMCAPEVASKITYRDAYLSPLPRKLVAAGLGDTLCSNFSDAPVILNFYDTILCTVSPMDKHGYFSMGMNPDYTLYQIRNRAGKRVFVEVNENYPPTFGNNRIHITDVDFVLENSWPLAAVPPAEPNEVEMKIAGHIAEYVDDGACLQLGIGGLPNAVGKCLERKKDLGIHSEMICDAFLYLYNKGALNNSKKNFMPGRGIGTFTFGSKELYEWVDMNPGLEMHGADFVNDARTIAQNDNMVAVNGIVAADITGQCVSEEINGKTYSGLGGQQDFTLGAWLSKGGKAFLATPSTYTDKDGKLHSSILPKCTDTVGISRWMSQYIVTEYGAVNLKGQTVPQRVKLMISIAHPDFREELVEYAKKEKFWR
ncbi:MAG: 4-hydroxybutyrate CoA-transferase [Deltaproteobacteria bacterium]|nr:4-hydroxybutyrate CoA-transferase [Deltaproteobacteria bacterium]